MEETRKRFKLEYGDSSVSTAEHLRSCVKKMKTEQVSPSDDQSVRNALNRLPFTILPCNVNLEKLLSEYSAVCNRRKHTIDKSKIVSRCPVGSGKEHFAFNQSSRKREKKSASNRRRESSSRKDRCKESVFERTNSDDAEGQHGLFKSSTNVKPMPDSAWHVYDDEAERLLTPSSDMFCYSDHFVHDFNLLGFRILKNYGWVPDSGMGRNGCRNSVFCRDQCHSCKVHTRPVDVRFSLSRMGFDCKESASSMAEKVQISNGIDGDLLSTANVNRTNLCNLTSVATLAEKCRINCWGYPIYIMTGESGPLHKRQFHYKVRVNNVDYVPHAGSSSKKQAKADAATGALYALGFLNKPSTA